MGDLGDTIPGERLALAQFSPKNQTVVFLSDGFTGVDAVEELQQRLSKIRALAGGEIGRKNSAQLFIIFSYFCGLSLHSGHEQYPF
jgi:hypothetical protein